MSRKKRIIYSNILLTLRKLRRGVKVNPKIGFKYTSFEEENTNMSFPKFFPAHSCGPTPNAINSESLFSLRNLSGLHTSGFFPVFFIMVTSEKICQNNGIFRNSIVEHCFFVNDMRNANRSRSSESESFFDSCL